jgi:hypothetical protein
MERHQSNIWVFGSSLAVFQPASVCSSSADTPHLVTYHAMRIIDGRMIILMDICNLPVSSRFEFHSPAIVARYLTCC